MIPLRHRENLDAAIRAAFAIVPENNREPDGVSLQVERHRWAWKPADVKLLLIAESHVYTSEADISHRTDLSTLPDFAQLSPETFVRLIYCLGYGENGLLAKESATGFKNSGTPQFWRLFALLAGVDPGCVKKTGTSLQRRIAAKVAVLRALQHRGIWLLDASVHAIYKPGGSSLPWSTRQALHKSWWDHYGSKIVEDERPESVWVVGKGVFETLHLAGARVDDWIYQPQAKLPAAVHQARIELLLNAGKETDRPQV